MKSKQIKLGWIGNRLLHGLVVAVLFAWTLSIYGQEHNHAEHEGMEEGHDKQEINEDSHAEHEADEVVQDEHAGHDHSEHEADEVAQDAHAGHDHEEGGLELSDEQVLRYGLVMKTAEPGSLGQELQLRGEVAPVDNLIVEIPARISGFIREVFKNVGDEVAKGEILAVLDSREWADGKAAYLAAFAEWQLAQSHFEREKELRDKNLSSEQEWQEVQQEYRAVQIALRLAKQHLFSLGCTDSELPVLDEEDADTTRYEIRAPLDGVVADKSVRVGQSIEGVDCLFVVVDLSQVWAELAVNIKDLAVVHKGDVVEVQSDGNGGPKRGVVDGISPFVSETTRTATARVTLDNADARLRPGTFVVGYLHKKGDILPVVIERDAVQNVDGKTVVFVRHGKAYEAVPITVGRNNRSMVEVVDGLAAGTAYVAEGAYRLKSTVITSTLDSHAGHGH